MFFPRASAQLSEFEVMECTGMHFDMHRCRVVHIESFCRTVFDSRSSRFFLDGAGENVRLGNAAGGEVSPQSSGPVESLSDTKVKELMFRYKPRQVIAAGKLPGEVDRIERSFIIIQFANNPQQVRFRVNACPN